MQKRNSLAIIPNLFTLGNLFLGCLGIIFAFNDHIFPVQLSDLDAGGKDVSVVFGFNNRLYLSSFMIFGAAVLDFFDGFVARLLKAESPLGAQLDSLADVVTFGVLPGCIFYQLLAAAFDLQPDALYIPVIWLIPAFLNALAGAYRLARFNTDASQKKGFIGLPIPANGIFVAALPLIVFTNAFQLSRVILNPWLLYALIILFSWLMVSRIPMFSLKINSLSWKGNEVLFLFLALSALMVIFLTYTGIAATILLYAGICVAQYFFKTKEAGTV